MARLTQNSVIFGSKTNISVDVEVFKPESPSHLWVGMKMRYYFDSRLMLELESAITPSLALEPLTWLELSVKTKRKNQSGYFSNFDAPHIIVIDQRRLSKVDFLEAQTDSDVDPYPFMYDLSVLVNHNSENIPFSGFGMRFSGLSYHLTREFLSQLHTEVKAAWD